MDIVEQMLKSNAAKRHGWLVQGWQAEGQACGWGWTDERMTQILKGTQQGSVAESES